MTGATLLPFRFASPAAGVRPAPPAPAAAAPGRFADAMDGALGTERQDRADSGARVKRRSEPPKPRDAEESRAASARRADHQARPASRTADRAGERIADDSPAESAAATSGERESQGAEGAAEQPDTSPAEAATSAAAAEGGATSPDATVAAAPAAMAAVPAVAGGPMSDGAEGTGDESAVDGEDPLARGRRWPVPAAEPGEEQSETGPNGPTRRAAAAPEGTMGQAIQQARAEAGVMRGHDMGQVAQQVVTAAHAESSAGLPAAAAPVTQAIDTASSAPQTASAADAVTAIEKAVSAIETVAAADAPSGAGTDDTETHEQPQPKPQAPNAQASAAMAASTPSDGVRFTPASAAGSAAYTSAAPRGDEAVLPQIVKSIRLHAVQGTTEARVQLKPEHLGHLNITLRVEHNQVTATIQADVAAVRQWIESHEASLRQALSEQGLQLTRLVVHPDDQQAATEERDGERPRRQARRRSWRDEDVTFEVLA